MGDASEIKMTDNQPSEAQVKELWEWLGWRYGVDKADPINPDNLWFPPNSTCCRQPLPPIDLNNLFKYAVPKPIDVHFKYDTSYPEHTIGEINCWLYHKGKVYKGWSYDPALALFWAIWEVIHNG